MKRVDKNAFGLGRFNCVIFKDMGPILIAKIEFLNEQTNICWFKYELRGFYDFILRNIVIGQYHIYRKQMKKCFFLKMRHYCTAKTVAK